MREEPSGFSKHGGARRLSLEIAFTLKNQLIRRGGAPPGEAVFIVIGGMGASAPINIDCIFPDST
jgi:hypothetical protein